MHIVKKNTLNYLGNSKYYYKEHIFLFSTFQSEYTRVDYVYLV